MGNDDLNPLPHFLREKLIQLLAFQADLHGINPLGKADFVRDYEYDDPHVPPVDKNFLQFPVGVTKESPSGQHAMSGRLHRQYI